MRYQSGNTQYRDRINKCGNKKLRKILYFMIFSMISLRKKGNNHIWIIMKIEKTTSEETSKVAVIACINKFLKVAFHLIYTRHTIRL